MIFPLHSDKMYRDSVSDNQDVSHVPTLNRSERLTGSQNTLPGQLDQYHMSAVQKDKRPKKTRRLSKRIPKNSDKDGLQFWDPSYLDKFLQKNPSSTSLNETEDTNRANAEAPDQRTSRGSRFRLFGRPTSPRSHTSGTEAQMIESENMAWRF